MGQRFSAVISTGAAVDQLTATLPGAALELGQGLRLLYADPLDGDEPVGDVSPVWSFLLERIEKAALSASALGPVAYVEGDYSGGHGWQSAVVWRDGSPVVGPLISDAAAGGGPAPVNEALRALGVVAATGLDEWETVQMHRVRNPEPEDDEA